MQNMKCFVRLLEEIVELATSELESNVTDRVSIWSVELLKNVVIPEMCELLQHAQNGKVFHKYGKGQRLLESTYLMADSLERLSDSMLGRKILELQNMYNSL